MVPCHQNSVRGTCFSHGEVSPGIKMAKFHLIHIASSVVVLLCSNWDFKNGIIETKQGSPVTSFMPTVYTWGVKLVP